MCHWATLYGACVDSNMLSGLSLSLSLMLTGKTKGQRLLVGTEAGGDDRVDEGEGRRGAGLAAVLNYACTSIHKGACSAEGCTLTAWLASTTAAACQ